MKQIELINEYVMNNSKVNDVLRALQKGEIPGVQASDIQTTFGILRNNASSILNCLFRKNKIIKINSRPVKFLANSIIHYFKNQYGLPEKNIYTIQELKKYLLDGEIQEKKDAFASLCGWNGSLKYQIELAKSAIAYPPKGLHTLILGESGVGKSAIAKAMHEYGKQVYKNENYPFITFNCADYGSNPQLLLSQLFGHVKNAFTGADKDKIGLVEKADGGILFLDEVHRLPPEGQEMLFMLMDKGEYNRLGDTTRQKSKVLIIAATTGMPSKVLLKTFTRRIPIVIKLSSYREKPILEKTMIIEKFLIDESIAINKTLYVAPIIFKALVENSYSDGNVGKLLSDVKLFCARAYYEYIQGRPEIKLDKTLLLEEFDQIYQSEITKNDKFWYSIEKVFPKGIPIIPKKASKNFIRCNNSVFYKAIIRKITRLTKEEIEEIPFKKLFYYEKNAYLKMSNNCFSEQDVSLSMLQKNCLIKDLNSSVHFIDLVKSVMNVNFASKTYLALGIWLTTIEKSNYQELNKLEHIKNKDVFIKKVAKNLVNEYKLSKLWWQNYCQRENIHYNNFISALTALWLNCSIE